MPKLVRKSSDCRNLLHFDVEDAPCSGESVKDTIKALIDVITTREIAEGYICRIQLFMTT